MTLSLQEMQARAREEAKAHGDAPLSHSGVFLDSLIARVRTETLYACGEEFEEELKKQREDVEDSSDDDEQEKERLLSLKIAEGLIDRVLAHLRALRDLKTNV